MALMFTSTKKTGKKFLYLYLNLIIFIFVLSFIYCQGEDANENDDVNDNISVCDRIKDSSDNKACFNNLLIFNSKRYQSSNFAINNNGDVVIGFSEHNDDSYTKLFYGLKNDGRNYFSEESPTYEINVEKDDLLDDTGYYNYYEIYKSINLFISLKGDKKKKQYLFSIDYNNYIVELHDLNNINNNNSNLIWNFDEFFNLEEEFYIIPYRYHIFEIKKETTYIITFIPLYVVSEEMAKLPFIKKFSFKSFDSGAYNELNSLNYSKYVNSLIIDNFLIDDYNNILAVLSFYDEEDDDSVSYDDDYDGPIIKRNLVQNQPNGFILTFYTPNLKKLLVNDVQILYLQINPDLGEDYIYCKSIYLKDFYIAFIYFSDLCQDERGRICIYFEIYKLDIFRNLPIDNPILSRIIGYINKDVNFKDILSDFVKIDNNRLVFISTNYKGKKSNSGVYSLRRELSMDSDESTKITISLIDFFGDYSDSKNSKIRHKEIIFNNYQFHYQISGFAYNGYLLFSSTVTKSSPESLRASEDSLEYNSLFMIFGYANGTDEIIDISPFFNDTPNYQEDISFLEYLLGKIKIENNLFGYFPVLAIKIISIPEEISIFDEKKNINITNNSLFEDLDNEKIHKLSQNKNLLKTSQYYYLDYQYILLESNSLQPSGQGENNRNVDLRILDIEIEKGQRIYYGRTNRLKFKLCHDYCETCNEISIDNNNQKCLSCLPLYQYDYWYYKNDTFEGNCVPEKHFYDINKKSLISCKKDYKFYVNTTDNKTICFDNHYNCPEIYPYFNDTTRECLYCSYERYKEGDCILDDNRTNNTIHDNIKGIISAFSENDDSMKSLKMSDKNNFYFKITTTNEQSGLKQSPSNPLENSRESIIDLKECTDILKREYGYDNDTNFIILKYENDADTNDKSVQYEVYAPGSDTKLDLSVCSEVKIDIYIPVILDEKTQELYDDLKAQGYNLFDKNDKFYTDICTPYKSPNGTDVLLSDR